MHPTRHALLLAEKLEKHCLKHILSILGSGGAYGEGDRMSIATTRACIDAVLGGAIKEALSPVILFLDSRFRRHSLVSNHQCSLQGILGAIRVLHVCRAGGHVPGEHEKYKGDDVPDYSVYGPKI